MSVFAPPNFAVFVAFRISNRTSPLWFPANVNAFVKNGELTSSEGNALSSKLQNAITNLNGGNTTAGVNQLHAFINQINAFVKSCRLTTDQAQLLIDAANQAIASAQA